MSYACVVLYRSPVSGRVFAEADHIAADIREFPNRDDAIAFAEQEFSQDVPYQIVELDEL